MVGAPSSFAFVSIARLDYEEGYAIVLEKLDKQVADKMIERIDDKQLRHRIYQAILRGMLIAMMLAILHLISLSHPLSELSHSFPLFSGAHARYLSRPLRPLPL